MNGWLAAGPQQPQQLARLQLCFLLGSNLLQISLFNLARKELTKKMSQLVMKMKRTGCSALSIE
jgi:hypothetical protein